MHRPAVPAAINERKQPAGSVLQILLNPVVLEMRNAFAIRSVRFERESDRKAGSGGLGLRGTSSSPDQPENGHGTVLDAT